MMELNVNKLVCLNGTNLALIPL
uniref:Uncharacterized protein n=1 Tax=Rhizophora mucronata TaxID=61149 RepID=A0A2P2JYQ4_RHIMU